MILFLLVLRQKAKKKLLDFLKPIISEIKKQCLFVSSHKIVQTLTTISSNTSN